ncbi:MAG: hypothetical protein LBP67_01815 [Bacteroidales bacterium]|jgi:hypothetical protein|nr:hypothetical protein [Bacteroidales bacterium]
MDIDKPTAYELLRENDSIINNTRVFSDEATKEFIFGIVCILLKNQETQAPGKISAQKMKNNFFCINENMLSFEGKVNNDIKETNLIVFKNICDSKFVYKKDDGFELFLRGYVNNKIDNDFTTNISTIEAIDTIENRTIIYDCFKNELLLYHNYCILDLLNNERNLNNNTELQQNTSIHESIQPPQNEIQEGIRQFTDEQKDLLKSYFDPTFKGMGRSFNYFDENLLIDLRKKRIGREYAEVALLIFDSGKFIKKRKETFTSWYKMFCSLMGIKETTYKKSQLNPNDELRREFYYL